MRSPFARTVTLLVLALLVCLALAAPSFGSSRQCRAKPADTVFTNGYVYTVNDRQPRAQAVAVRDGKIVYVGCNQVALWLAGPKTKLVDLKGRMMMPGLQDGHTHLQGFVACNMNYEGGTEDYVLSKIRAALLRDDQVDVLKSNYVLSCDYFSSQSMLPSGTRLTRWMLDRLSKDPASGDPMATGTTRPIVVNDLDGHTYIVNSKAIENAGITKDTVAPPGSAIGRDANGEPNGFFADYTPPAPFGDDPPSPPNETYLGWRNSIQLYNQKGTTSIWRSGGSTSALEVWKQMADNGDLTMRVNQALGAGWVRGETDPTVLQGQIDKINAARAQYDHYTSPTSPGSLAVDSVKVFADGVVEYPSQTAAMLEPYNVNVGTAESPVWIPGPSKGEDPSVEDAVLGFKMLDANHWTIHVHAIGNRGVRSTLDDFAACRKANGRWDSRHTIVHVEFVDPADMPRFGRLGVVPNFQLQWAERDTYTIDGVEGYLSQAVLDTIYPARSLMKYGAVLAGGSDFPVDALSPWREIEQAVTRAHAPDELMGIYAGVLTPWERLTLRQAIRMHTMGSAYQLHQDRATGSIQVGKFADLIVLDRNLFKIPIDQVSNTKVLITMLGGKVVWQDATTPL
jgi:predicted amidohydrolase YtcJ